MEFPLRSNLALGGSKPAHFFGLFSKEYFTSQLESIWSVYIFLSAIKLFPQYLCSDIFPRACCKEIFVCWTHGIYPYHSFETWWVNLGPGWSRAETGLGWRKNRKRKNPMWPGQKPGCNPLIFFFTKTMSFWFKKKNDPDDLVIRSKTRTRS